jgi:hypothetical protein
MVLITVAIGVSISDRSASLKFVREPCAESSAAAAARNNAMYTGLLANLPRIEPSPISPQLFVGRVFSYVLLHSFGWWPNET